MYLSRIKQIEETILIYKLPIDPEQDVIKEESSQEDSEERPRQIDDNMQEGQGQ